MRLKKYTICPSCIVFCVGEQQVHFAEVGVLEPVFEKSTTALKLKSNPKLLRCKNKVYLMTFNIRTLERIGQLPELTASVTEYNIDIRVQKHKGAFNKFPDFFSYGHFY